jgi:hypothetical protein
MTRRWPVPVVWAVGLVVPMAVAPGDARACLSAVAIEVREQAPKGPEARATQLVAQAEQDLSEGKHAKAATKAIAAFPVLQATQHGPAGRALRVVALAVVRTDGAVNPGNLRSSAATDRATNLAWAAQTLRDLNVRHPNNPSYRTDLGEALSRVPAERGEAARILGDLAAKDLITSAEGYAALARLRAASGDKVARDAAVARCEAMTKNPSVVCAAPVVTTGAGQT